jgi:quercetin dioxygenase-like cupin family protein
MPSTPDAEALSTLSRTLHLSADDVPYVQTSPAAPVRTRVLHARPDEGFVVMQLHASPGVVSSLHVHHGPVFGWTTEGRWGHDDGFAYRPGTYIFETPGVQHRFMSGPDDVEALYVLYGTVDMIDPDSGEVTGTHGPADVVNGYLRACEEAKLPRPNVLR